MQIVCPQCQAEYELDPPAAPFARDQDLVFRCSACSASIPLRRDASAQPAVDEEKPAEPAPVDSPAAPDGPAGFVLRQEGNTYHVRDEAMLQRWIAERRIWPDDEVSESGGEWKRVGDVESYRVFFSLVDEAERGGTPQSQPQPAKTPSLSVAVKPGLFARPSSLDVVGAPSDSDSPEPAAPTQSTPTAPTAPTAPSAPSVPSEVEDFSTDVVEVEPDAALFGEIVPEEESTRLADSLMGSLDPDEPTMDMELSEEDFFSEEQHAVADRATFQGSSLSDTEDDDLEWGQHRRRSMAMWWLMFFGALGGVAYLALDFLNDRDAAESSSAAEMPGEQAEPAPVAQPEVKEDTGAESDAAGELAAEEPSAEEPSAEEPSAEEPAAEEPAAEEPAAEKPAAQKTPPAKTTASPVSASGEINKGWTQIDKENWSQARIHFDRALQRDPGSLDGRLGIAYVNEKQGRMAEAISQYCRLQATASGDVKIEASGRLRALGKECP